MKWTLGLLAGLSLTVSAFGVGCADAPRIPTERRSTVSSTLATYDATAATKSKYGITKWRLRHVADGSVLEGLDAKGKRISHISLALRKGTGKQAAMFWFSGKDNRKGFVMSTGAGASVHSLPGTLPNWSIAARRDLAKFAESGKTPYGCADDIFGLLGTFLKSAPECAKTDSLRSCVSKLSSGGGNKLGGAAKALQSCMKAATSSSSSSSSGSSGKTTGSSSGSTSSGSSSGSTGKTSSSSSSGGAKDTEEEEEKEPSKTTTQETEKEEEEETEKESTKEEEEKEVDQTDPVVEKEAGEVDQKDPVEKEAEEPQQTETPEQTEQTETPEQTEQPAQPEQTETPEEPETIEV